MKKLLFFFLSVFAASLLWSASALAEDPAEWTVMFYFCGSDLESKNGFATENLEAIQKCLTHDQLTHLIGRRNREEETVGRVNVVVETGGCKEWHAQRIGMDVDAGALQRWHFEPDLLASIEGTSTFMLDQTLPLANMGASDTLADFIRWSAQTYPAQKYALVLWDHGGGSKTGIFVDELFDGDIMYLDELHTALQEGGVQLEAVVFDACLMANIEAACAIQDSARWMIASEELVAGGGTAMGDWLQQLYFTPQWDGRRLGRWICDMTQIQYANSADEQAADTLTWSVIDLSKIKRVEEQFDRFFRDIGQYYADDILRMNNILSYLSEAFEFGLGENGMLDLSAAFYNPYVAGMLDQDLHSSMLDALDEAVVYTVRGTDRSSARGLSFCYATDFSVGGLEDYARNCPSPHYLAFLDAITPAWTAPAWVYDTVEPLPDIQELYQYQISVKKIIAPNGTPGVAILDGVINASTVIAELYRYNEETGNTVYMGSTVAGDVLDKDGNKMLMTYALNSFWRWPTLEGEFCCAEVAFLDYMGNELYNIPVQINGEIHLLRCSYDDTADAGEKMTVLGLWQGYDADSLMFSRNVMSLAQKAGQEFRLLYPVRNGEKDEKTLYDAGKTMTLHRAYVIKGKPLPAGTYFLEYWVQDPFMRLLSAGDVEIEWDGETVSLREGSWEGDVVLLPPTE